MRPACAPVCTTFTPPGTVLQNDAACAAGDVITSTGRPKLAPPSVEEDTQIWLGPKSWYSMYTRAVSVVPPGGIHASVHGRSTKNGLFVLLDCTTGPAPSAQCPPKSTDLYTSVCSMLGSPVNTFRLPWYTAPDAS